MNIQFRKAERKKSKLRCALIGISGSGKTWSALALATGIGGKILVIDTENGSADLYANDFDYSVYILNPPFSPQRYVDVIRAADKQFDTIIIDSLSHAWAGEGGALDMHTRAVQFQKGAKNSYTAWNEVTPQHNILVNTILQSQAHIIATMRAKTHHDLQENASGKKVPVKIGLAPIQRDGLEYEFSWVADLSNEKGQENFCFTSKDRTKLFMNCDPFKITTKTGEQLREWLETGIENAPKNDVDPLEKLIELDQKYEQELKNSESLPALKKEFALGWHALGVYKQYPEAQIVRDKMKTIYEELKKQFENAEAISE